MPSGDVPWRGSSNRRTAFSWTPSPAPKATRVRPLSRTAIALLLAGRVDADLRGHGGISIVSWRDVAMHRYQAPDPAAEVGGYAQLHYERISEFYLEHPWLTGKAPLSYGEELALARLLEWYGLLRRRRGSLPLLVLVPSSSRSVPGGDYLEKIVQLQFDLPSVLRELLRAKLFEALEGALPEARRTISTDAWRDIHADIVEPLIRNMRDVRRYTTAVRGTVTALEDWVEVTDILGLEAVRLFLPEVFQHLHAAVHAITFPMDSSSDERRLQQLRRGGLAPDPILKDHLQKLIDL